MKRIALWVTMVIMLCIFAVGCGEVQKEKKASDYLIQFDSGVSVSNGVVEPEYEKREIQISEDGSYVFQVNCTPDHEGLLTGCVVYDEENQVVFMCTGEEMQVESKDLDLVEGIYTVEFRYLNSIKGLENFVKDAGTTLALKDAEGNPADNEYEFEESGSWNIHLEYGVYAVEGHSMEYLAGVVCGGILGLLLLCFLMWLVRKMGGKVNWNCKKGSYDERQMLARGQAYKAAFFTMMGYVTVISLMDEIFEISMFMSFAGMWIGVCLSVMVFVVICIWKDAYMSLYENARGVIMLFSIVGVLNVGIGILNLVKGRPILENGVISADCINLMVGILFVIILIVFGGRLIYNKNLAEEEEE